MGDWHASDIEPVGALQASGACAPPRCHGTSQGRRLLPRRGPRVTLSGPVPSPSRPFVACSPSRRHGTSQGRRFSPRNGPRETFSASIPSPSGSPAAAASRKWREACQGRRPTPRNSPRENLRMTGLSPPGLPVTRAAQNIPRENSPNGEAFALGPFCDTRGAEHPKGDGAPPESFSLGASRGTYSSSSSPLLLSFSLPARLSASRKIHSTCAFALRMSSSAQRSTAAQIFGSMRRGYCLRRATNVCSCEC